MPPADPPLRQLLRLDPGTAIARSRAALTPVAMVVEFRRRWVLGGLVVAQWAIVAHEALGSIRHNDWLYYHGGDGTWYWTLAHTLGSLHVPQTRIGFGWSYVLMPFTWIFGANMIDGLPAVVLLNVVVLAPIALVGIYLIAERIAGRIFGLWAALVWVVAPSLVIHLYRPSNRETLVDAFFPIGRGLNALSDYPSMVGAIVAGYLVVRALDTASLTDGLVCGIATGFLVGIKPSNAIFAVAAGLAFLVAGRPRATAAWLAGMAPALITLAIWKATGLGRIPILALGQTREAAAPTLAFAPIHHYLQIDWSHLKTNKDALREVFWSIRLLEYILVAGTAALLLRARAKGLFVVVWFGLYGLVKGASPLSSVYAGSLYRLIEPAWPAWLLLVAAIPLLWPVGPRGRILQREWDATRAAATRPLGRVAIGVAVAVFAVLPFAVVAAASPIPRDTVVWYIGENLEVPVVDFHLRARASAHGVVLSWNRVRTGRAKYSYRLLKGRTGGCAYVQGAPQCNLTMPPLGSTRSTSYVDRAVRGRWFYRVGLAADWRQTPSSDDVMLISPPVSVTVR